MSSLRHVRPALVAAACVACGCNTGLVAPDAPAADDTDVEPAFDAAPRPDTRHRDTLVVDTADDPGEVWTGFDAGPAIPTGPSHYAGKGLWAGGDHTCFLDQTHELACVGANRHGELGPTPGPVLVATRILGLHDAQSVAIGDDHACAIRADRTVACWGLDDHGQLGDGATGERSTPMVVPGLADVDAIAVGHAHSCAVTGGEVWCWGLNDDGQLGDGTTIDHPAPAKVVDVSGVSATFPRLVLGSHHGCAGIHELEGGKPMFRWRCWGRNVEGQLGDGTVTSRPRPIAPLFSKVTSAATGATATCVVDLDGHAWCAGSDLVHAWGPSWTALPEADAYSLADGGGGHLCGTQILGLRCWGDDAYHQLGRDGLYKGGTQWTALSTGKDHTCAAFFTGLRCWGKNDQGQTGKGSTSPFEAADVWMP